MKVPPIPPYLRRQYYNVIILVQLGKAWRLRR